MQDQHHDYSYILHAIELVFTAIIGLLIYIFNKNNKVLEEKIKDLESDLFETRKDFIKDLTEIKMEVNKVKSENTNIDKSLALLTKQIELKDQHTQQYLQRLENMFKELHKLISNKP